MANAAVNTTYLVIRSGEDRHKVEEFLAAFTAPNIPKSTLEPVKIETVPEMNKVQHSNDTKYWDGLLNGQLAVIASNSVKALPDEMGSVSIKRYLAAGNTYTMVVVKDDAQRDIFKRLFEGVIPVSDPRFPIYTLAELVNPEKVGGSKPKPNGFDAYDYQNNLQGHLAIIYRQIDNGISTLE